LDPPLPELDGVADDEVVADVDELSFDEDELSFDGDELSLDEEAPSEDEALLRLSVR
jgi:hypothetical protein